jgi:hypothetical protein
MRQFTIFASLIGGVAAFIGFWIAYQWDLPVGPTDVVLLGIIYALGFAVKKSRSCSTQNQRHDFPDKSINNLSPRAQFPRKRAEGPSRAIRTALPFATVG